MCLCTLFRNFARKTHCIMKKIVTCLLASLGLTTACAQQPATKTFETDVFKTKSGKPVTFHALMHSCIRIEFDGKEIEIDPVAKMRDRVVDYSQMPKADYIFVTHEHGDHYDPSAIRLLSAEKTKLVMNKRCTDMFGSGLTMANGQNFLIDDIKVEAVPAYNTTEGRQQFHPKGRDNGYILTLDGLRIYIAGDTEDIPEMADIKDIDIAFLPCNQPYTMTPEQLIKAAKTIKPKVLFPYHYGQTDVSTIPSSLKSEGIDVRIRHYESAKLPAFHPPPARSNKSPDPDLHLHSPPPRRGNNAQNKSEALTSHKYFASFCGPDRA